MSSWLSGGIQFIIFLNKIYHFTFSRNGEYFKIKWDVQYHMHIKCITYHMHKLYDYMILHCTWNMNWIVLGISFKERDFIRIISEIGPIAGGGGPCGFDPFPTAWYRGIWRNHNFWIFSNIGSIWRSFLDIMVSKLWMRRGNVISYVNLNGCLMN